jgi:NTE family protein
MNVQFQPDFRTGERRLPFECVALVLQGGGALGAYQVGVYEALAEANINPDWVAGVSIGAINSAIIAGNEPAERVAKLRTFWQEITVNPLLDWTAAAHVAQGDLQRALFNQLVRTMPLSRAPQAFSGFGSPLPGCCLTARSRPRASMKPSS